MNEHIVDIDETNAAALLIDYVLTVAVSVTAGIAAFTSALRSLHWIDPR